MPTKMDRMSIILTDDTDESTPKSAEQSLQGTDVTIGGKKYRVMMVTQDDIGFKFLLQKSGTTTQYEVRHNLTPDPAKSWSKEAWSCGCPAWTRHGDPRSCKHSEAVSKLVPKSVKATKESPKVLTSGDLRAIGGRMDDISWFSDEHFPVVFGKSDSPRDMDDALREWYSREHNLGDVEDANGSELLHVGRGEKPQDFIIIYNLYETEFADGTTFDDKSFKITAHRQIDSHGRGDADGNRYVLVVDGVEEIPSVVFGNTDDWKKDVPKRVIEYTSQQCERQGELDGDSGKCTKVLFDDLPKYHTMCGDKSKDEFTKEVMDYLRANSPIDYVVGEVAGEVANDDGPYFQNMAVKWKGSNRKKVAYCFICGIIAKGAKEDDECEHCGESMVEGTEWSQMSQRFSQLIAEHNGSLRNEDNNTDGWDCYESE